MNSQTAQTFFYDGGVAEVRVCVVRETPADLNAQMSQPDACARFFREIVAHADWFDPDKECTVVLLLDRKNRVRGWNLVSLGSLTTALAHPREVFRAAIAAAASAVILMHNHPSGDPQPSVQDMQVTRLLRDAARTVEIRLLDHVIVGSSAFGGGGFYSFSKAGVL